MNANLRNFAIWVIVGLLVIALFQLFQNPGRGGGSNEIAFSQFLDDVESGKAPRGVEASATRDVRAYDGFVPKGEDWRVVFREELRPKW